MNSDGASEPLAIWNWMRTPSMVISSPVFLMYCVGGISPGTLLLKANPRPVPSVPLSLAGRPTPYMYWARRDMALPASTFSAMACSMKASGAMIFTLPERTSASSTTPRTPPKWSAWLWV